MKTSQTLRLNDDLGYRTAQEKLTAFGQQRRSLEKEQEQLRERFQVARTHSSVIARARALLFGSTEPEDAEGIDRRLGEIADQIRVVEAAIALARGEREKARDKASRRLCDSVRPEHRKLALRVIAAAGELAAACQAESDFRATLERNGTYPVTLPVIQIGSLGRLDDIYGSKIRYFLLDCHAAGLIPLDDLPASLQALAKPRPAPKPVPLSVRSPRTKPIDTTALDPRPFAAAVQL